MNKALYTQATIYLLIVIVALSPKLKAQVTMGSSLKPNPLSLLDLKENDPDANNANSARGLGLPRVKLTDMNNLFPMFETIPESGVANSQYSAALKPAEDLTHTGLMVYNLNKCSGFGPGTYVWVGNEWQPLSKVNVVQKPKIGITSPSDPAVIRTLNDSTFLIHLPSGKDRRIFPSDNKFSLSLSWEDPVNGSLTVPTITELTDVTTPPAGGPGPNGGLRFLTNPASGWAVPPITTSPMTFDYTIKDMSDVIISENANTIYPYRSRETAVTFKVPANICYGPSQIQVRLNQTNYRMTFNRNNQVLNESGYRLRSASPKFSEKVNYYRFLLMPNYSGDNISGYREETNARWNAAYEHVTDGILVKEVVGTGKPVPTTGGKELIDGSFITTTREPTYISSSTDKNRGKTAGILSYTDTATIARYYPVEIHFVQCASKGFDDTGIEDVGRSTDPSGWGTKVLKHQDIDGNDFYSASFGSAGRWMTTNLAATHYDTESGLSGSLAVYQTIDIDNHDAGAKKYAYPILDVSMIPNPGGLTNSQLTKPGAHWNNVDWSIKGAGWRPIEGILYNWYAATGRGENDNGTTQEGANGTEPAKRQGICPNGWYLPSDRDWNQLEQAIYENIGQYSTYDAVDLAAWNNHIPSKPWVWNTSATSGSSRGGAIDNQHVGHGGAMKDPCPPTCSDGNLSALSYMQGTKNYSKEYYLGGFNATTVGRIKSYVDKPTSSTPVNDRALIYLSRGYNATFWTSAQNNNLGSAWIRDLNTANGGVTRTTYTKTNLLSVRCKKQ
ncbi:hypothetical protein M2132_000494 [Dysgonomonas sp. PH5-45]|uniref:FISUMP domain-containing protein n=1 Tax=unclassified Dysgonomonas TaxID=2630389 RepID=UPI002474D6ED|nr:MULTISPECIES: FISUMP domain-containing protein [unclassified Dysgonomonas]MDH6354172.1 hypothetical protein [Dysgonomonas sp. PH5-45]MDH6386977.1 hypothetical protein [Dysgonomonas sp. PH5-37]